MNEIIKAQRLKVENVFINKNNINAIISKNIECEEIDLLSVDIDGNDFHILNSITCIKPRVVVIEYNAKFVPPVLFCIDYNASHKWERDDYFGASLKFLESNLKDYYLVGCNITGTNAFFVRKDLTKDNFFEPFSAENHYEPARYFLIPFPSGHPASYKSVKVNM